MPHNKLENFKIKKKEVNVHDIQGITHSFEELMDIEKKLKDIYKDAKKWRKKREEIEKYLRIQVGKITNQAVKGE